MKQIIQDLRSGKTILQELPAPALQPGHILIRTSCSLISAGTERMLVEFSKASLISKARNNPDRVAQVLDKIKTDGLVPTLEAVFRKLEEPLPLGYCNAGVVVEVAKDVTEFIVGDRVASNGMHAEYVCVPKNLAAKIPDSVSDVEAAFTVIGAIGLQSVRLAQPQLGETIVIIGLGLIGLITCQLLQANGCRVIGFDIDHEKVERAKKININAFNSADTSMESIVGDATSQAGADGAIITASAKNDSIINSAAQITRKRGRIILVGVVDMHIDRNAFYKKEITFQISCSYGPGRYDDMYEQQGIDYPIGYVRWTEKRNFEAVLQFLSQKQLAVMEMITRTANLTDAEDIYGNLDAKENGVTVLEYDSKILSRVLHIPNIKIAQEHIQTALIGAGNFTRMTLLPALQKSNVSLQYISSHDGLHATLLAKKYKITKVVTDNAIVMNDDAIDLVMIATRHDSHADLVTETLQKGKHVFVEKPLAINEQQLKEIEKAKDAHPDKHVFTGFNRRFSPYSVKAKKLLQDASDMQIVMTINAGILPEDHWLLDENIGGGRIIGEGCHFFDLMSFFTGSTITSVYATGLHTSGQPESAIIHLSYKNGCHGTINYFCNGHRTFQKESIEIFSKGRVLVIDNFKSMKGYGFKGFNSLSGKQNKGHIEQFKILFETLRTGAIAPIPFSSLLNTTRATFAAVNSIRENRIINIHS